MRAMYATLLNHYHLTLPEIGRLTDRQISDLYFHPRDEAGAIKPVEKEPQPGTLEFDLREARTVAREMGADVDEVERRVRDAWTKN